MNLGRRDLREEKVLSQAANRSYRGHRRVRAVTPRGLPGLVILLSALAHPGLPAGATETQDRYYAHQAVHDDQGVIAPWYTAQNGQLDFRARVAAETIKRYPWTTAEMAVDCVPHFLFSGHWNIADDGTITPLATNDWDNGDLGQRAAYVLSGLVDYYRYSGDPAAVALMTLQADFLLDHCLTPDDHPWPRFLISVPNKGKSYGKCDPQGIIQLDIAAEAGLAMLKAYQVTGQSRWLQACRHWGDLLAAKRNRAGGAPPWSRYANPETVPWKDDTQTGGVVYLLYFLDELLRLGYSGPQGAIVEARDAGRAYLRDTLLDRWTVNDVWGRNYWDWEDPVQAENVTEFVARYMMDNPDQFPHWRTDARNILALFFNHTGVCPHSAGEVYSGAWAFPESNACCGRSLWYGPMELAIPWAQYGRQADSLWARELARRMQILATYDGHDTGVSEDNIDGGFIVNKEWFKIAHPSALKHLLGTLAWLPEEFGAARENHIMRSTAVVNSVVYRRGVVQYSTYDAPPGTVDVVRLAFVPARITAGGRQLRQLDDPIAQRTGPARNGFVVKQLSGGDALVTIRHDGATDVVIQGDDPQRQLDDTELTYGGQWEALTQQPTWARTCHVSDTAGAEASMAFVGNQVRLIGSTSPEGGLADVYVDDKKQLVGIDCWCPTARHEQVLYYRNGLADGPHSLRVVVRGTHNPKSRGAKVYVDALQYSAATGAGSFGAGGGPTETQCLLMGYPGRQDARDALGKLWRPGAEFIIRTGAATDSVARSWWTTPAPPPVLATEDPTLYRYGVHGKEFVVNVTVGPGDYYVRLKFAANRRLNTCENCVSIAINGRPRVAKMDVAATAGGTQRAVDLVFNNVRPRNGMIDVRFTGGNPAHGLSGEAFVQGVEVGPGGGEEGAAPVTLLGRNLLDNGGFERWIADPDKGLAAASCPAGWRFEAEGAARLEKVTADSPEKAGPEAVAEGSCACRVLGSGRSRLMREVAVCPAGAYRASVLVAATAPPERAGAAAPTGASAELLLEELDSGGQVAARHRRDATPDGPVYRYVALPLTTSPATARLRFTLVASLPEAEEPSSISYDQCVVDGPPAPARLVGTVVDEARKPLADAVVALGSRAVRTGADGGYAVAALADLQQVEVVANKQGYLGQSQALRLQAGENRCDFALAARPTNNLLDNGDFEAGFSAARSMEHGTCGMRGPWHFRFSPGINCYIYPESLYRWRRPRIRLGSEAISQVTDGGGTMELYQDVVVNSNQPLTASAWVLGLDVNGDGQGFGAGPADFAGLVVQELDSQDRVVKLHERVGITKATADFELVKLALTTGPDTVKVRLTLTSHIRCIWQKGAAIFDQCALEPAAAGK
jgi:hypothetical protein